MGFMYEEITETQEEVYNIENTIDGTVVPTLLENQDYLIQIKDIVEDNQATLARIESTVYEINETVTDNKETLALINATVNLILEIVTPPTFLPGVQNYGCDGIDQDDDDEADNCEEDTFAPVLVLPHSSGFIVDASDKFVLSHEVFSSSAEAESLLKAAVGVKDDCANETSLEIAVSLQSVDTCSETFTLTPRHVNRGNCADMDGEPRKFVMKIDPAPPQITCGFASEQGDYLFLDEGSSTTKSFFETNFSFAVEVSVGRLQNEWCSCFLNGFR
jgi:hypothetical protein